MFKRFTIITPKYTNYAIIIIIIVLNSCLANRRKEGRNSSNSFQFQSFEWKCERHFTRFMPSMAKNNINLLWPTTTTIAIDRNYYKIHKKPKKILLLLASSLFVRLWQFVRLGCLNGDICQQRQTTPFQGKYGKYIETPKRYE